MNILCILLSRTTGMYSNSNVFIFIHYLFTKGNQTKANLQYFLNKDTSLTQWLQQQQSTASGDTRQLASMVMGTTPSLTSNCSLSESLARSQKLPSDPSLLRSYEGERAKGNALLRKVVHFV